MPPLRDATALRHRVWGWILGLYLAGVCGDLAWHVHRYLTTGDRRVQGYEWVTGLQASLFWPVHLAVQAWLSLF